MFLDLSNKDTIYLTLLLELNVIINIISIVSGTYEELRRKGSCYSIKQDGLLVAF